MIFVLWPPLIARAADVDPDTVTAALVQVELWIDLGERSSALALTRRAVQQLPHDARWHLARLRVLHDAGLQPWIEAEYETVARRSEAAEQAYAQWQVETGRRLAPPPGVEGLDFVHARLALARGAVAEAQAVADRGHDAEHLALAAEVRAATGDVSGLARLAQDWPGEEPSDEAFTPLLPLFEGKASREVERARAAILARVDTRIAQAEHPLGLLRAAQFLLALGDNDRLEALRLRLRTLMGREPTYQERLDGFAAGPGGWTAWDVPRRARWGAPMLDEVGKLVVRQGKTELVWGRAEETRRMALAAAEEAWSRGLPDVADAFIDRYVGGCAPSRRAEVLARSGKGAEGRALAEDRLLRCVGGTDLFPTVDVAGLEVEALLLDHAEAWAAFGRVADLGGATADAALAFGIAARLQPEPDRVAIAARRAREAGMEVDGSGLPSTDVLAAALESASWLSPLQALQASRARLARARTSALLAPNVDRLVARITPDDMCLATLRERCQLERAVALEAARRAGRALAPDDVQPVRDAGALRAAAAWLDDLERARFLRTATLRRLARPTDEAAAIARILDGDTGVALGRTAPRWAVGAVRSTDLLGEVVVLSFWASWCRPCFAELPLLDGMTAAWEKEGVRVRVIAVSVDEDESAYRRALGRLPWDTMSVVRAPELRHLFDVKDLPTTWVVDGAGVSRAVRVGYDGSGLGWLDEAVRTWDRLSTQ